MTIRDWSWNLICKSLLAAGIWIVLWDLSPTFATIVGMIASLCVIAYLHDDPKAQIANKDFTAEFKSRLAVAEANAKSRFGNVSSSANLSDSFVQAPEMQPCLKVRPASSSTQFAIGREGFSIRTIARDSAMIAGAAVLFHMLHVPAAAAMAFLLVAIFSVSGSSNWFNNLAASGVGTFALSLLFFEPIGSIRVSQPMDQAALAIFILVPLVAYPLVNSRKMVRI